MQSNLVLVIDADQQRRDYLCGLLEFMESGSIMSLSPEHWRDDIASPDDIQAVVLGPCGSDGEQQGVLGSVCAWHSQLPVVMFNGQANRSNVQNPANVAGVFCRVLPFPPTHADLSHVLAQARLFRDSKRRHSQRNPELFRCLVGKSHGIQKVRELIKNISDSDQNILILGEPGTGKEVVARNVHYHSARRDKPFVSLFCGAVPADLLESELFGHEKGAFKGAVCARQGRIELAEAGTLFLDDISELSLPLQTKLLRVLREHVFERVGSDRLTHANVRIMATTHRNLIHEIENGRFREDLHRELRAFPIEMPALRERLEDLPLLVTELNARVMREKNFSVRFTPAAIRMLQRYEWPANLRELAEMVEGLAVQYAGRTVDVKELPEAYQSAVPDSGAVPTGEVLGDSDSNPVQWQLPREGMDLKEHLSNIEYNLIIQALHQTGGIVAHAASLLRLRRTTLVEKLRKYGVRAEKERRENQQPMVISK
jgi:sigma-54 specific flagellar transcriptional regulator A